MLAHGFRYQEDDPDILVDYHIVIKDKTTVDSYHQNDGRFWNSFEVYDYTEGTLVVHLVVGSNKKLIWQGSAASLLSAN